MERAPLILHVSPESPEPEVLERAAGVIHAGGLVAFPTETVYGLGADALNPAAVRRIFEAKGRPSSNPLIVHVASVEGARALTAGWPETAARAAAAFWPGPLTLVLPKRAGIPDEVTAGLPSVAVRIPGHAVAQALLEVVGRPLAAPSANRSLRVSPTTAAHVARSLGARVDLILDGGPTAVGIESTVLDLTGSGPRVLRPGSIGVDALSAALGIAVEAHDDRPGGGDPASPSSPGMMERHYAPDAELRIAPDRETLAGWAAAERGAGSMVGIVALSDAGATGVAGAAQVVVLPGDPAGYARGLYAALHTLDAAGCQVILLEAPPCGQAWTGVNDRLRRASRR
jgi:L-threonylcarbamoyladenylate synthase